MRLQSNLMACLTAAAFMGVFYTSCSSSESKQASEKEKEAQQEAPLVKIQKVYETDVMQKGVYMASAEADLINNISTSTPNRIKEIFVDEGMKVSKGEKLVVLDPVNTVAFEAQVQSAKAGVDNAQASVANAKANLDNVKLNYDRALELFKIGGGTKQNVDAMETQYITAKNSYDSARSALESAKKSLASAQTSLENARENTVLVSPVDGVVTARYNHPGDMTSGSPILTIAKTEPIKVVSNISEKEFSKIRMGMEIDCTFDTYGDEVFTGKVTMISPTIDAATRTFGIEVSVPNHDSRILPGMFGRVTINFGTERHVVVPDMAVVKQPGSGNQYVYVYKDGKVDYRKVELGQRIGTSYELLSGVEDGAEVVVSGKEKLVNGAEVRVK